MKVREDPESYSWSNHSIERWMERFPEDDWYDELKEAAEIATDGKRSYFLTPCGAVFVIQDLRKPIIVTVLTVMMFLEKVNLATCLGNAVVGDRLEKAMKELTSEY